jgi:hypothetical protein
MLLVGAVVICAVLIFLYGRLSQNSTSNAELSELTAPCANPNENAKHIFDKLVAETDLTQEQVAGIVGNLRHESASTFSPFVHEYSQRFESGGWGIAQWTGYRRDNDSSTEYIGVAAYARDKIGAETFDKYYHNYGHIDYDCTPEGVPEEVNVMFLDAQVDFLIRELTYRPLGFYTTYSKLKETKTVEEASDIWLKYYEGPADLESTTEVRRRYSREIYEIYAE